VREALGGHCAVFSRDGRVGARLDSVEWLDNYKDLNLRPSGYEIAVIRNLDFFGLFGDFQILDF
jgi:hypothetical protein